MSAIDLRAPTAADVDQAVQIAMEVACPKGLRRALLGLLAPAGTDLGAHPEASVEAAADAAVEALWARLEDDLAARRAAAPKPRRRARQKKGF